jgi:hypothetical protein
VPARRLWRARLRACASCSASCAAAAAVCAGSAAAFRFASRSAFVARCLVAPLLGGEAFRFFLGSLA